MMTTAVGMTKQLFFQTILESVRELPISELIRNKYEIPSGVCPFHKDKTPGSFTYSDRHHMYKCWSCNERGDAIQFVQHYEKLPFEKSVLKIAVLFDVITAEQAEMYFKGSGFEEVAIRKVRSYVQPAFEREESYRATTDVIHNVLSLLAEGETILGEDKPLLSEQHHKHLTEERELDAEAIKQGDYFTMPSRTSRYLRVFFQELKTRFGYEPNKVEGVPGFYKMNEKPIERRYTFATKKGIGIPIRDAEGILRGIQIRRDKVKKGESRYVWLSSGFANDEEDLSFGTGAQSPIHVSYPKENKFENVVFLTEGVFKSQAIARSFSSTALSLQGILNWKHKKNGLLPTLEVVEMVEQTKIEHIYLAFDSDIRSNIHVYQAVKDIYQTIEKLNSDIELYYVWWDDDFGKGIDDLIQGGYQKQMRKVPAREFVEAYDKAIDNLEERMQLDVKDAVKELGKECLTEVFDEFVRPLYAS